MYSYECEVMCVSQRILWTQEEAIVLLDALIKVLNGHLTRSEAEMLVSKMLRKRAMNCGVEIDDTFRNITGIHLQMLTMEYIYTDGKSGLKKATMPKLFQDVVDLYNNNKDLFYERLQGISSMENGYNVFEWNIPVSLSYTRPVKCTYCNDLLEDVSSWKDVYCGIVSRLYTDYPDQIASLINTNITTGVRLDLADPMRVLDMISPFKISDFIFLETNYSATDIAVKLKKFLDVCNVDYQNVVIYYDRKMDAEKLERVTSAVESYSVLEKRFIDWMVSSGNAQRTAQSYTSSIRSAERYASKHSFTYSTILTENLQLCEKAVDALLQDAKFKEYDIQQHRRFSAAMKKYVAFLKKSNDAKGESFSLNLSEGECADTESSFQYHEDVSMLLQQYFPYGFKHDSVRDLMRFRMFAEKEKIHLPDDDEILSIIMSVGTVVENKIFVKSDKMAIEMRDIVNNIFDNGINVVYYETLLNVHIEWMKTNHISSETMLKELLKKEFPSFYYSKRFMVKGDKLTEKNAVTSEIKRVWGDCTVRRVEDLAVDLPYVPLENIWRVISGNSDFAWVSEGVYFLADSLIITPNEEQEIIEYVQKMCDSKGYVSINELPLEGVAEQNYELPLFTIQSVVYHRLLFPKYTLNGKILSEGCVEIDDLLLLKQYLSQRTVCTFEELTEKDLEYSGSSRRQNVFKALYDCMVRIDNSRFVSDNDVYFNIEEIDAALSSMIKDRFCAIKEITTFALFPLCGQDWNHYLLESYCYRYSRRYSLHVINFNDKNAGIIAEKSYSKSYIEMLTLALAKTDIELTPEVIGPYLFQSGYTAKRNYGWLAEIAALAENLRKEI